MTYEQIVDDLRSWFTSEEHKKRLLNIWQTPSLRRELQAAADKSGQLVKVQNQLHSDYHHDRFLRDQLIRAADIPNLQHSLNEKVPETAQEAMHRIANRLSSEPKSAAANYTTEQVDHAHYGIGMKFGGKARKNLKGSSHKCPKRRLNKLLASQKGCYVCGEEHRARKFHTPQEILKAIERIKRENPSALFSVGEVMDVQFALMSTMSDDDDEDEEETDDEAEEQANFISANSSSEEERSAHDHFTNFAFVHRRTFASDLKKELESIDVALSVGECTKFNGIITDTAANRSSVMSLSKYKAYCEEFRNTTPFNRLEQKTICGLNSKNSPIETATISIPFKDLDLWIDVQFRIMTFDCPSLLSMKDMPNNCLDLIIQNKWISYKHKLQGLIFENYFLIHRWNAWDSCFYTEPELKLLQRVFGHPSVTALKNVLKRADPEKFNADVEEALHSIKKECMTCEAHASKSRRFKLTVGTNELRFNHIIAVDIMYINKKPAIHVVDEATQYQAALFLRRVTAEEPWKAILKCWFRVYLGPPEHLRGPGVQLHIGALS